VTIAPPPLLPASGVRWSDLRNAVDSAGGAGPVRFGIAEQELAEATASFQLELEHGWPGFVRAVNKAPRIELHVTVGPDPAAPAAKAAAASVTRQIREALRAWGAKPEVPSWEPRPGV